MTVVNMRTNDVRTLAAAFTIQIELPCQAEVVA